jgi:hypothetical protein
MILIAPPHPSYHRFYNFALRFVLVLLLLLPSQDAVAETLNTDSFSSFGVSWIGLASGVLHFSLRRDMPALLGLLPFDLVHVIALSLDVSNYAHLSIVNK